MKKKALIISLSILVVILSLILYIFYDTAPKQIENEKIGTMYTFGEITFDLVSDNYEELESFKESAIEKDLDLNKIMVWHNENDNTSITIMKNDVDDLFDNEIKLLKNPIHHIYLELQGKKGIIEYSERIQEDNLKIKKLDYDIYKNNEKIAVLQRMMTSDGEVTYQFEIKIGDYYYIIVAYQEIENNLALENIITFMKTVNIK